MARKFNEYEFKKKLRDTGLKKNWTLLIAITSKKRIFPIHNIRNVMARSKGKLFFSFSSQSEELHCLFFFIQLLNSLQTNMHKLTGKQETKINELLARFQLNCMLLYVLKNNSLASGVNCYPCNPKEGLKTIHFSYSIWWFVFLSALKQ